MNKKAHAYVVAAAILWGNVGIFFKELSAVGFSSMQVVSIRVIVSAIVMTLYLFVTNKKLLKIDIRDSGLFVGTGILSLLLFNWCFFKTIEISKLSVASVLLYTCPIFVVLLSAVLFGEKLTRTKIIALIMTFCGCVLVTGVLTDGSGEGTLCTLGIITGIGSGFWYALYSIFGTYALKKYDPATVSVYTFIFAAVGSIPIARLDREVELLKLPVTILCALGIGTVCCMLPFMFYTKGLAHMETSRAAIIATLDPVVSCMVGVFIYHEEMTMSIFSGIVLILAAIILLNKKPTGVVSV